MEEYQTSIHPVSLQIHTLGMQSTLCKKKIIANAHSNRIWNRIWNGIWTESTDH